MVAASAAPRALPVPDGRAAEFLRTSGAFRNALRRAARSNVGLPPSGRGRTDVRRPGRQQVLWNTGADCTPKARTPEDDDACPEPPPTSLPLDAAVHKRCTAPQGPRPQRPTSTSRVHASSASRLRIAMSPAARARGQKRAVVSSYSATKTALPARTNGWRRSHSWYWKHCSSSAQSKPGSSAAAWSRSFLSPTDEAAGVRGGGEEAVVAQLVGGGQREAAVVGVAVDVVGLDRVEALLAAEVEAAPRGAARGHRAGGRRASARRASRASPCRPPQRGSAPASGRPGSSVPASSSRRRAGPRACSARARVAALSNRSMSNISASTGVDRLVELPLPRRVRAPGSSGRTGGLGSAARLVRGRGDEDEAVDAQTAPAPARDRCGLARRRAIRREPAANRAAGAAALQPAPVTRPISARRAVERHHEPRGAGTRASAARRRSSAMSPGRGRARAVPPPSSNSARRPLALASRTTCPAPPRCACARLRCAGCRPPRPGRTRRRSQPRRRPRPTSPRTQAQVHTGTVGVLTARQTPLRQSVSGARTRRQALPDPDRRVLHAAAGQQPAHAAVRGLPRALRLLERRPDARLRHLHARPRADAAAVRPAVGPRGAQARGRRGPADRRRRPRPLRRRQRHRVALRRACGAGAVGRDGHRRRHSRARRARAARRSRARSALRGDRPGRRQQRRAAARRRRSRSGRPRRACSATSSPSSSRSWPRSPS